jgi:hypothetical protein
MRKPFCALLLGCASLLVVQAEASGLPDSCGNDSVRFNVKLESKRPLFAGQQSGQAQVVFIEALEKNGTCIGVDGAWVGANQGNSYFSTFITAGKHNFCSDVQSKSGKLQLGMATLNAEAGGLPEVLCQ